ncbi:hypothetical protein PAXRUDRAFT_160931 [Paxillus rubicundulus Ve08.2h10]|uniref:Uncharacterized protein n=1 Tax=Paxillus rubicundulus Ve08.2h10 TaxID=930991 RepID=A0A0D0D7C7_9AGAM|nr:hypothetical protein PAXRUDRAFT_160931 [Paxillus rubicundulus Ve08.2h10]
MPFSFSEDEIISDEDCDNIHAFNFLMTSKISWCSFNHMRWTFRHKFNLNSEFIIFHQMGILSGVKPVMHDCCPDSCIAYTEKYIHNQFCPFCKEARFHANGKPRHQYAYFPLIPRLKGYFQSLGMIKKMSYCASYHHQPGDIADVFDGDHYQ